MAVQSAENGLFEAVRGHSGSAAMSPFDRERTPSYSTLIDTMRLSCTGYLSKVADFDPPDLHLVTPCRISGLSCGVVCVILRLAVLVELPSCDRQTDGHRPIASNADA